MQNRNIVKSFTNIFLSLTNIQKKIETIEARIEFSEVLNEKVSSGENLNRIKKLLLDIRKNIKGKNKSPIILSVFNETVDRLNDIIHFQNISNKINYLENRIKFNKKIKIQNIKDYVDKYTINIEDSSNLSLLLKKYNIDKRCQRVIACANNKKNDTYKKVNIDFQINKSKNSTQSSKRNILTESITRLRGLTSISIEEFHNKVLYDDEFVQNFVDSSLHLLEDKLKFYNQKIIDVKDEYLKIKTKVNRLKNEGTENQTIRDVYPMYDSIHVFIIDLEELVKNIHKKRTSINLENIRNNLIQAINDKENGLNSIIGRTNIKNKIISQLYSFSKCYKTFLNTFNNIAIYGDSGSGKTRIAKVISFVYSMAGILATDKIKIVTRPDLVGQYVGQTAPRTRSLLFNTIEGILFIDEAYQLATQSSRDFGKESITEIVNFIDKYIGMNIIIVAGYSNLMKKFMNSNEGLPRRFPHIYILESYSDVELTNILLLTLKEKLSSTIILNNNLCNFIYSLISKILIESIDIFKNQAGDMLNLSSSILKTIYSLYDINWINDDYDNNTKIIIEGFNDFLFIKGYQIE